jgi:hypothetical protein
MVTRLSTSTSSEGTEVYTVTQPTRERPRPPPPYHQHRRRREPVKVAVEKEERLSCCAKCCCLILCLLILAIVGGILLWQLLPEKQRTDIGTFANSGAARSNLPSKTEEPPPAVYAFHQCESSSHDCCNGISTICDLTADSIMYAGVHNAMATAQDGFRLAPNHNYNFELALERGYRAIAMDIGMCDGQLQFIHGKCILGKRDPLTVFQHLNDFLDENPNDVVLFAMEVNNFAGGGQVDLDALYSIMQQVSGFTERFVIHDNVTQPWPTLRELIALDQRVMMFHFNGPTCAELTFGCPTGVYDYFEFVAEGGFIFDTVEDIQNVTQACSVPRGATGQADFFGINLFTLIPQESEAPITNSKDFIEHQIEMCTEYQSGIDVDIIYVDFWDIGDAVEVVQERNIQRGQAYQSQYGNSTTSNSNSDSSNSNSGSSNGSTSNNNNNRLRRMLRGITQTWHF